MGCPVLGHMLGLDSSPSALLSEAGWTQRSASTASLTEDSRVASQKHAQKGGCRLWWRVQSLGGTDGHTEEHR